MREPLPAGGTAHSDGGGLILAGDVGGTTTRLAIFDRALSPVVLKTYPSREHSDLSEILRRFISESGLCFERACFGIAGPVRGGRSKITNLPWLVDARDLSAELGLEQVGLINDLEASAYGIDVLQPTDLAVLNEGAPDAAGNAALIAAGTGLGQAGLYWDGRQHRPFACEGGHSTFGPRNDLEEELGHYLLKRTDHVSWERVVSGPGLLSIYQFLRDSERGEEPAWLTEKMRLVDPSAAITEAGLEGSCALCVQAMDLFVSLYGAEAGNLALKVMATGGVFVGGGIAPRILRKMTGGSFMEAFTSKGPMRPLLEAIPVRVILNDRNALIGAARYAALTD